MESTGRIFVCGLCRTQVLICSHCDRGQIYCTGDCAWMARRQGMREAGRRYQGSRRGRFAHAQRSQRYRLRQQNVTHQGSPGAQPDDLLVASSTLSVQQPPSSSTALRWQCQFCGCRCSEFVRSGFLRRRRGHEPIADIRTGAPYVHSP
jgi:hypothetical protein